MDPTTGVLLPALNTARQLEHSGLRERWQLATGLIDKHSDTIEQLRQRLGFEKDTTVIAWLLEQLEQSLDLGKTIADLLGADERSAVHSFSD